ncbi:MAG: putative nucleic acid-binding Zn-ribbon protein [Kiritimatiellia bacterium]|jgi:predicted  nucleic acid-binding Zn-ribbon protein
MIEQHLLLALAVADLHINKAERAQTRVRTKITEATELLQDAQTLLNQRQDHLANLGSQEKQAARETQLYEKRQAAAVRALETGLGDPDAAERQVDQCQNIIADLETKQLELMEDADSTQELIEAAERQVASNHDVLTKLEQNKPRLMLAEDVVIREETDKRVLLYAQLPRERQDRYDILRKKRGTAVSRVVDGYCRACRVKVPVMEFSDVRRGLLKSCGGCGRVLALDPT